MNARPEAANLQCHHLIAVRPEPPGQFTAYVFHGPAIQAVAATEKEAIEKVRQALADWLASARLVSIYTPSPPIDYSELRPIVNMSDPLVRQMQEEYMEELARMKREDLERTLREYESECPNSSSTPTT